MDSVLEETRSSRQEVVRDCFEQMLTDLSHNSLSGLILQLLNVGRYLYSCVITVYDYFLKEG